jgi:hypothetical protein
LVQQQVMLLRWSNEFVLWFLYYEKKDERESKKEAAMGSPLCCSSTAEKKNLTTGPQTQHSDSLEGPISSVTSQEARNGRDQTLVNGLSNAPMRDPSGR